MNDTLPQVSARVAVASAPVADEPSTELREHRANIRRLRFVLGIGLLAWNVIGIPNDVQVTRLFDLSYRQFTIARLVISLVQLVGWSTLFLDLGPRGLRVAELTIFVSTSAGLAALNHGLASPTPLFVSCALIAQGIAMPRPWREGVFLLGATLVTYPLALLGVDAVTHRNTLAWHDSAQVFALGHTMVLGACTLLFVVLAGDGMHRLKRRALAAQRVGRYRLVEKLGGGGMGEVWRARHPGLAQEVALKLARTKEAEVRLAEEAKMLIELEHPSTVRILDSGRTDDGRFYYAMELVRGQTLDAFAPLPEPVVRTMVRSLARALAEAHDKKIVHRDVKPENVMLADEQASYVKLLDFGVAERVGAPGHAAGSPRFMAPEQRRGDPAAAAADVFALAAVAFFALTGRSPLDTATGPALEALASAGDALGEVSEPTRSLLLRGLSSDPTTRPTAGALAESLT